ncbi:8037_t:CDS:2 [Scutellospora calospora]|uniref:8037_t:CDS:1 n=1 Tax=Scutellospora calospora TaxID=85575 RepID=A0ACA9KGW8_9GLOM|nr:8037_t:CDS:2 [Scutellospora calospora]
MQHNTSFRIPNNYDDISRSSSLQVEVENPPTYEEATAETPDSRRRESQNTVVQSEIEEEYSNYLSERAMQHFEGYERRIKKLEKDLNCWGGNEKDSF